MIGYRHNKCLYYYANRKTMPMACDDVKPILMYAFFPFALLFSLKHLCRAINICVSRFVFLKHMYEA